MSNEDWRKGYQEGFNDGYDKAKKEWQHAMDFWKLPNPLTLNPVIGTGPTKCSVCGMEYVDSLGRLKTMGYVCNNPKCPGKVMCSTQAAGMANNTVWPQGSVLCNQSTFIVKDPGAETFNETFAMSLDVT
jgi:hypothetical protein